MRSAGPTDARLFCLFLEENPQVERPDQVWTPGPGPTVNLCDLTVSLCSLTGHFLGNNTVIDVLRRHGYEVEHTLAGQPINRYGPGPEENSTDDRLRKLLQIMIPSVNILSLKVA